MKIVIHTGLQWLILKLEAYLKATEPKRVSSSLWQDHLNEIDQRNDEAEVASIRARAVPPIPKCVLAEPPYFSRSK